MAKFECPKCMLDGDNDEPCSFEYDGYSAPKNCPFTGEKVNWVRV